MTTQHLQRKAKNEKTNLFFILFFTNKQKGNEACSKLSQTLEGATAFDFFNKQN